MEYEEEMVNQEIFEQQELSRLEYMNSLRSDQVPSNVKEQGETDRLIFLRKKKEHIQRMFPIAQKFLEERLPHREWNWDDFVRQKLLAPAETVNGSDSHIPSCISNLKRRTDVFDLALRKGVVIMNFVQRRSDNMAAALGSDAYKTYMIVKALMRLRMDQIDFTRIERKLTTQKTYIFYKFTLINC